MNLLHPEWAMIIGGGSCVWDDVLAWETLYGRQWDGMVVAANDIGAHWPRAIDAWVTFHGSKMDKWKTLRDSFQRKDHRPFQTWGPQASHRRFVDQTVLPWAGGSSGMLAIQVALEGLKCTKVILCGVPMTPTAHFAQTQEKFATEWQQATPHWKVWPRNLDKMIGRAKSMSGRTQELLGTPTLEWLLEA